MQIFGTIRAATLGAGLAVALTGAALAGEYNITIDPVVIDTGEFTRSGVGFNVEAEVLDWLRSKLDRREAPDRHS